MAQNETDSLVSKALLGLAVEQVRALGTLVKQQEDQIINLHQQVKILHLELRDRLDSSHKQNTNLHNELRETADRAARVTQVLAMLLFVALLCVARLIFVILR